MHGSLARENNSENQRRSSFRVHESDQSHAVDQRTAVYLRADNVSDRLGKATVEEIEWFLQKRQKSAIEKTRILELANRHSQVFFERLRAKHQLSTVDPKGPICFLGGSHLPARTPVFTQSAL
jgi:hypothetical protein